MTTLLIPTAPELDQLRAGTLTAFLRPMEPQPPEWFDVCHVLEEPLHGGVANALKKYGSPGDVIAWGEEWYEGSSGAAIEWCDSRIERQPASTMPVEIAVYKSTVAECRPVKLDDLVMEETARLGFAATLCLDWQTNYPSFPFADSWAWWIGLKGTQ